MQASLFDLCSAFHPVVLESFGRRDDELGDAGQFVCQLLCFVMVKGVRSENGNKGRDDFNEEERNSLPVSWCVFFPPPHFSIHRIKLWNAVGLFLPGLMVFCLLTEC